MTKTTAVEKLPEPAAPNGAAVEGREPPEMKAHALSWQAEGYSWREAFIRLPENMILQDLNDPGIFVNIQRNRVTAMQRFDRATLVSWDESWMVKDAVVIDASATSVVLSIKPGDVVHMRNKGAEWQDDKHRIRWAGNGFAVFRRADDIEALPTRFDTLEAAKSEAYRLLYPARR